MTATTSESRYANAIPVRHVSLLSASGKSSAYHRAELVECSDSALMSALGQRCADAMAEIYRRHGGAVSALAQRVLGEAQSDDVVQDVFVRLWNSPSRFDPSRGSLRTYLLTVAHGRSVDLLRSEVTRRRREGLELWWSVRLGDGYSVDVDARFDAMRIRAALAALAATERQAIDLAYFAGYTYREVARHLDIPEGTGKARIRVGLRHLGNALSDLDATCG